MKQRRCKCGCISNQEVIELEQLIEMQDIEFIVKMKKGRCPECGRAMRNDKLDQLNKLRINKKYREMVK